jgi:hypothetical protein
MLFYFSIARNYPDITENDKKTFSRVLFFRVYINLNVRIGWIGIDVLYPSGEPFCWVG